jgi:hypothetical protein
VNARRPAILAATRPYRGRVGIFRAYDSVDFWIKVSVSEAGPRKICRASRGYKEICYGEAKMTRTLILITLLMAPFAVQAQTLEFGSGGLRVTPHGGGDCRELRAACMHKEELGETGRGNCQRYRELCTGGARSEYHHRHVYEEQ